MTTKVKKLKALLGMAGTSDPDLFSKKRLSTKRYAETATALLEIANAFSPNRLSMSLRTDRIRSRFLSFFPRLYLSRPFLSRFLPEFPTTNELLSNLSASTPQRKQFGYVCTIGLRGKFASQSKSPRQM